MEVPASLDLVPYVCWPLNGFDDEATSWGRREEGCRFRLTGLSDASAMSGERGRFSEVGAAAFDGGDSGTISSEEALSGASLLGPPVDLRVRPIAEVGIC